MWDIFILKEVESSFEKRIGKRFLGTHDFEGDRHFEQEMGMIRAAELRALRPKSLRLSSFGCG